MLRSVRTVGRKPTSTSIWALGALVGFSFAAAIGGGYFPLMIFGALFGYLVDYASTLPLYRVGPSQIYSKRSNTRIVYDQGTGNVRMKLNAPPTKKGIVNAGGKWVYVSPSPAPNGKKTPSTPAAVPPSAPAPAPSTAQAPVSPSIPTAGPPPPPPPRPKWFVEQQHEKQPEQPLSTDLGEVLVVKKRPAAPPPAVEKPQIPDTFHPSIMRKEVLIPASLLNRLDEYTHNSAVSERLVRKVAERYPTKSGQWCAEKALWDIERDRH